MAPDPTAAGDAVRTEPGAESGPSDQDAIEVLLQGDLEIEGRLVDASNTTLRAMVANGNGATGTRCVYKPIAGERPLWDFPDGTLAARELAAYRVSLATGWDLVPPTVLRDGPLGPGMVQLWIDEERQVDEPPLGFVPVRRLPAGWRPVAEARDDRGRQYVLAHAADERLARLAVFDAVVNNADRKGGHVIATVDGRVLGVDHGVCFNVVDKLRTVLWGWAGEPLPADAVEVLDRLRADLDGDLGVELSELLTTAEVEAVAERVGRLVGTGCFPVPEPGWPAVPWPPM